MTKLKGNAQEISLNFIEGKGLSPYSVLEAAWVLPGILAGLRDSLWKGDSTHPIFKLWLALGLITKEGKTTLGGIHIERMEDLFEYEFSMIQQQLSGNFKTDPEKYEKLRGALAEYSSIYLEAFAELIFINTPTGGRVLDFGGGSGYYLKNLLMCDKTTSGVLYDKSPASDVVEPVLKSRLTIIKENFHETTDFFTANIDSFDTVILSEILHCIAPMDWEKLFLLLDGVLKSGGRIVILEQNVNFRLDWRLRSMSSGSALQSGWLINTLKELFKRNDLTMEIEDSEQLNSHYSVTIQKK